MAAGGVGDAFGAAGAGVAGVAFGACAGADGLGAGDDCFVVGVGLGAFFSAMI